MPPGLPLAKARRPVVGHVFAAILIVVGGLLLGWAIYGLRILSGEAALDRENAMFMAKLMVFAGGPIGLALVAAGSFGLWLRRRRNANTQ